MKIHSLVIKKLYDHLDFKIKFFRDVNFLEGINGSGKTSVLNVIYWILTPSLLNLAQLQFDTIKLDYKEKGKKLRKIVAKQLGDHIELSISDVLEKLEVPVFEYSRESRLLERQEQQPSMAEMYERYKVDNKDHPVLKTLEALVGPFYLPLGRRWQAARSFIPTSDYRRRLWRVGGKPTVPGGPIGEVLYLAERYYRERQFQITQLNEKLRENLVVSTFETVAKWPTKMRDPWKLAEVQRRKDTIVKGLKQAGISVPEESVLNFFNELERIAQVIEKEGFDLNKPSKHLLGWLISAPQVNQVERVISRIENYNRERESVDRKIHLFLDTVNSFLNDSDKQIRFNPSGELVVQIGKEHEIRADSLSSGESQLLILFTFLYFGFETEQEFIMMIDEPELSLHLGWQHNYVNSVLEANPNAQFIFATHSPEIGQAHKDKSIELSQKG